MNKKLQERYLLVQYFKISKMTCIKIDKNLLHRASKQLRCNQVPYQIKKNSYHQNY